MSIFSIHMLTLSLLTVGLFALVFVLFLLQRKQQLVRRATRHERYLLRFSSVHYQENKYDIELQLSQIKGNIFYFSLAAGSLILCAILLAFT